MKLLATLSILATAYGVSAHAGGHRHGSKLRLLSGKHSSLQPYHTASPIVATPAVDKRLATPTPLVPRDVGVSTWTPFCSQPQSEKRASTEAIAYKGNVGTAGNYGCNLMLIQSDIAGAYDHTVRFNNPGNDSQHCVCWLKIGPDGGINGFFQGNQALEFDLAANGGQTLAIDADTQGGCACGVGGVPVTTYGQFASTWLEFDMANASNGGWSGADASSLVSAANGLDIPGLQVCGHGTCSTICPGGTGINAYVGGMEAEDGVGLNISPGEVRLEVMVDHQC